MAEVAASWGCPMKADFAATVQVQIIGRTVLAAGWLPPFPDAPTAAVGGRTP